MDNNYTVEQIIDDHVPEPHSKQLKKVIFGRELEPLNLPPFEKGLQCELKGFKLGGALPEQLRAPRIVRIGLIQHSIVLPTTDSIADQKAAIHEKVTKYIEHAAACGVNIICMHEMWMMPMIFCTREKYPWTEFAEDAYEGPTNTLMSKLASKHKMVIVSSILERDSVNSDIIWNTTVVINSDGKIMGKQRKNHIPRNGDFNESTYYMEGNLGHPVFDTTYGKIGVVTCFGRHHPLNWYMYGINGAEIVFNPCCITSESFETLWHIEARCAAISNSYFTCAMNRVGTEVYPNEFTSGDGAPAHRDLGEFFGSSYITAPDGTRTPGLNRINDGLLVGEVDLNHCRQVRDRWNFRMTRRLELYANEFMKACQPDFKPQVVQK